MGRRVTLELSDEVFGRAERLAGLADREVEQVLAEAVSAALPVLDVGTEDQRSMTQLADAEVLRLANLRLSEAQDRSLSRLLDRQREGDLDSRERAELLALIQRYEAAWLQQAAALAEAVRRGLRGPLEP
jgi:predicted transcriptional regulator